MRLHRQWSAFQLVFVVCLVFILVADTLAQQQQQNQQRSNGRRQNGNGNGNGNARRQKQQKQQQQQQQQQRQEYGSSGPRYDAFGNKKTGYKYTLPPTEPTTTTTRRTTTRTTTTTTTTRPPRPKPGEEYFSYEENDSQFIVPEKPPAPVSPIVGFVTTTAMPITNSRGSGWDIRDSVPGQPAQDYPVLSKIPKTSFTCQDKVPGFYADPETRCQVFHRCTACSDTPTVPQQSSMVCPNGTLFNQQILTCDWWANVECPGSENYYFLNQEIGAVTQDGHYLQLSAYRRPPNEKKVAPRIIPQNERDPLPIEYQSKHHGSDYNNHHGQQQQQQNQPLPPIAAAPVQRQPQNPFNNNNNNNNQRPQQNQFNNNNNNNQRPQQNQYGNQPPQQQQRPQSQQQNNNNNQGKLQNNFKANQQAKNRQTSQQQRPQTTQAPPPPPPPAPQPQAFNSASDQDNFYDEYFNENDDNVLPAKTNIQTILTKIEEADQDDMDALEQNKGSIVGFQAQNTDRNNDDNEPIPFRSGSLKSKGPTGSSTTTTTTSVVSTTTPRDVAADEDELLDYDYGNDNNDNNNNNDNNKNNDNKGNKNKGKSNDDDNNNDDNASENDDGDGEEIKEKPASFIVNKPPPENILETKNPAPSNNNNGKNKGKKNNNNKGSKKSSTTTKAVIASSTTPKGLDPPTINFEDASEKPSINNRSNSHRNSGIRLPEDEYLPPTTTTTTTTAAPNYLPPLVPSYGEPPSWGGYSDSDNNGGYSNSNNNNGGYTSNSNSGGYSGYQDGHSQSISKPEDEYLPPKTDKQTKPDDEYLPPKKTTPDLSRYVTPPPVIVRPRDSYEPVQDKHFRKPSNGYGAPVAQNQNPQYGVPAPIAPQQPPQQQYQPQYQAPAQQPQYQAPVQQQQYQAPVQQQQYQAPVQQQQYQAPVQQQQYQAPVQQQQYQAPVQQQQYQAPVQQQQYGVPAQEQYQPAQQQQPLQVHVPVYAQPSNVQYANQRIGFSQVSAPIVYQASHVVTPAPLAQLLQQASAWNNKK